MMLSAGTPLMTGGDEYLRSLHCNNNAYNVDSVANWLNYKLDRRPKQLQRFCQGHDRLRKAHAALRPIGFYTNAQVAWWTPAGTTPDATYFNSGSNHAIAYQFNGGALNDSDPSIYVAYNGWSGDVNFNPAVAGQRHELVPRHGYVRLGRRPEPGARPRGGGPDRRAGLWVQSVRPWVCCC